MTLLSNYIPSAIFIAYLIVPGDGQCSFLVDLHHERCESPLLAQLDLSYSSGSKELEVRESNLNCCKYVYYKHCVDRWSETRCPFYYTNSTYVKIDPFVEKLSLLCPDYSYNVSADYH